MGKLLAIAFLLLGFSFSKEITAFYNPNCGCCHKYFKILEKKGYKVKRIAVSPSELMSKKDELGVPVNKRSCHTMIIGDKFVEGHVPVKGIEALLKDPKARGVYSHHGVLSGRGAEEKTFEIIY